MTNERGTDESRFKLAIDQLTGIAEMIYQQLD